MSQQANGNIHWTTWVRNLPSSEILKVKKELAEVIKADYYKQFMNYLYRKADLPALAPAFILKYARDYVKDESFELDFTYYPANVLLPVLNPA